MESIQSVKQRFGIIGNNNKLNRALEKSIQVSNSDISVIVTGESGVGKENIPKIIHQYSHRKHANLNKKVIISGQGHNFEIWDENSWEEQIEKLERISSQVEAPQEIQKLSL